MSDDDYDNRCPNCNHVLVGKDTGHFVPPCVGDPGFFACADFCNECKAGSGGARGAPRDDLPEGSPTTAEIIASGEGVEGEGPQPVEVMPPVGTGSSTPASVAPPSAPAPSPPLSAEGERQVVEIEDAIRRLHHYGYPPDVRQGRVDADVLDIVDRVRGLVAEREQAERDWQQAVIDRAKATHDAERPLVEQIAALSAQVAALRAALRQQGRHASGCRARRPHGSKGWLSEDRQTCTCALRVLAEEEGNHG